MQRFSVDTIRDSLQLFSLLSSMSRELETLQQQLAALGSAKAIRISRSEISQIRAALQHNGSDPLNVAGLVGLLSQSQRAYAVVADTAANLPNPTLYEVGTLGAVISGGTTALYVVQEGNPRSWLGPSTFAAPANMMTTDTNQTPGATVVKTWTASQIFNGGLTVSTKFTLDTNGKITKYNNDTLAGNGVGAVVARYAAQNQSAGIGATTIFTAPADGEYVIHFNIFTRTAGAGTIQFDYRYTDDVGAKTNTFAGMALGGGNFQTSSGLLRSTSGNVIQIATTYVAPGAYDIYVALIRVN